jgi:predicted ester cyclase
MNIHRLVDGKIVEAWWSYDMLGMMQQLGVIPPMPDVPLPALNRKPEDYPWSPSSEVTGDPGDPETNKDLVLREELEGWKQGNVSVALEAIAPNFVNHDPIWPAVTDYESYRQWVESKLTGPLNITVDDLIAEGDKVVERVTVDTDGGIMESVMIIYRFADGKIVERWWSKDVLVPLQQLGIIRLPDQG